MLEAGSIKLGQHVCFDLIEELRRIDQQNHSALSVQIRHTADQSNLLRRQLRRRMNRGGMRMRKGGE